MAANITLTVNTQPAMQGLYKVNDVINQVKMNGQNITVGTTNSTQAVNNIKNVTKEVEKLGGTAQVQTSKIKGGIASLTSAGKKAFAGIKQLTTGMVSWWTAVIVAVELAAKTFTYFFNNLTESIPKVIAKAQNLVNITQKQTEKFEKERKETNELKSSLEELAKKETLTSSEQLFAQAIIDKLTERYKDLKLSIDSTTGAIIGYNEAVDKMNQKDRQQEIRLAKRQIAAQRQAANAQLANTFGTGKVSLDRSVSNRDFWSFAQNQFGDLNQMDRERITKRFNNGNLYDKKAVLEDLATVYNNNQQILTKINAAIDAMDNLIKAQQNYNELTDANSLIIKSGNQQLKENKQLHSQILSLQEQSKQAEQSLAKARRDAEYDALETNQQRVNFIKKELEQLNKQADQTQKQIQAANDQLSHNTQMVDYSKGQTDSFKKDVDERNAKVTELRKNIQQISKDLKKQTGKELDKNALGVDYRKELENRIRVLSQGGQYGSKSENDRVKKQLADKQAQLNAINKTLQATKEIKKVEDQRDALIERMNEHLAVGREAEKTRLQSQKKSQQLQATQAQRTLEIEQKKVQLAQLEKTLKEQQLKQDQAIQDVYSNYETQLENYNKSSRQIAIETALANAEKAKGVELTREQIDNITLLVNRLEDMKQLEAKRAKNQQQADAIEGVFKGYENEQTLAYMKMIGKQKQAVLLEAQLNAQKAKGAKLTEEELASLKGYVDVQQLIEEATNASKFNINTNGVITNQLAAKGGYASSVVTDRAQDIEKQILVQQKKQTDISTKIKDAIEKYSVIQ